MTKSSNRGLTEDATGTVVSVVKQTPGAISYAAFSGTRAKPVTEVAIDGVAPNDANIVTGKYPIWSYEHMFTNGAPTGERQKFIEFVQKNADLAKKNGFIALSDMKVRRRTAEGLRAQGGSAGRCALCAACQLVLSTRLRRGGRQVVASL